ncbi:two-component response regulator-like APRR1 [Andrographis paniculata]|uniref:two-component response regulator-like APRR1 n=1 Tax=Andrographis paniculata TaxID=175694 RepID=UPI0021E84519|nr:two-component response regulator-like APRR1 [Andrographis paniculata]
MEKSDIGKSGEGFIDRSKVKILLCDNDDRSSQEVFTLLCKCSYQVISVKSPRQVIDALNAEGLDIDLILSEVDLPMSKGLKMLKYIRRDKELRRIPVIMMSAQDEVPIVVKCLKFGAADYLVKPLRTNELLNLWTHMWRRRRMLGLMEKNIVSYSFDLVVSDHSDANTNSTTLFSDDTDEKSLKSTNLEACVVAHQEDEAITRAVTPMILTNGARPHCQPDVPGISDRRTGHISSFPRKSELKIGESSAFFTYIKTSASKSNNQGASSVTLQQITTSDTPVPRGQLCPDARVKDKNVSVERNDVRANDSPSTTSLSTEEGSGISHRGVSKESPVVVGGYPHGTYPYHMSMMPLPSLPSDAGPGFLPHYNQIPGTASYPFYPFGICLQPGHHPPPPPPQPWPSYGDPSNEAAATTKLDRREAALIKFRQKRKERCYDKKIRYVNRKKLAERRPRLRGQFVRKVNGIDVDLNGRPASTEDDDEEEDEEDQQTGLEISTGS